MIKESKLDKWFFWVFFFKCFHHYRFFFSCLSIASINIWPLNFVRIKKRWKLQQICIPNHHGLFRNHVPNLWKFITRLYLHNQLHKIIINYNTFKVSLENYFLIEKPICVSNLCFCPISSTKRNIVTFFKL